MMDGMPPVVRRHGPLALTHLACLVLAVSEFTTLYQVKIITVTRDVSTVGAHHGYALLILAVAAAVMAVGAVRGGSRPAAFAVLAIAVAALVIALAVDLPVVDEEGTYGRDYEQARAQPAVGFYLETAGAVLLLFSAVVLLVVRPEGRTAPARPAASEPEADASSPA